MSITAVVSGHICLKNSPGNFIEENGASLVQPKGKIDHVGPSLLSARNSAWNPGTVKPDANYKHLIANKKLLRREADPSYRTKGRKRARNKNHPVLLYTEESRRRHV